MVELYIFAKILLNLNLEKMNKLKFWLVVFIVMTFATSCINNSKADICDVEGMEKIGKIILKELEAGAIATRIEILNNDEKLTTKFTQIRINYKNKENESKSLTYDVSNGKFESSDLRFPIVLKGRELKENEFVMISKNANKAIEELKKQDIKAIGVYLYVANITTNPKYDRHTFRLQEIDEAKTKSMSNSFSYYNEYNCSADGEGNIEIK